MKKIFSLLILILFLFLGCTKTEIVQLDLRGTIKGEIRTVSEFGYANLDYENVLVQLEGIEPLISVLTDSAGKYMITDIPTGTYNYIVSKEGYGEYQKQGFQVVGGDEPLYYSSSLIEKSTTTVESLSLEIVNSEVHLKCVVHHNSFFDEQSFYRPSIRYFIHNSDNPSYNNYLQSDRVNYDEVSGSQLDIQIYPNEDLFPFGSKIYIVAYGAYRYGYGYYDILSNQYIYSNLGVESNIASITLP